MTITDLKGFTEPNMRIYRCWIIRIEVTEISLCVVIYLCFHELFGKGRVHVQRLINAKDINSKQVDKMGLCYLLEHSIYLLLDLSNPHQRFFKLFMKNHCKIHTKKGETCVGENRDQELILQGLVLSMNAKTFLTICHTKLCCWC